MSDDRGFDTTSTTEAIFEKQKLGLSQGQVTEQNDRVYQASEKSKGEMDRQSKADKSLSEMTSTVRHFDKKYGDKWFEEFQGGLTHIQERAANQDNNAVETLRRIRGHFSNSIQAPTLAQAFRENPHMVQVYRFLYDHHRDDWLGDQDPEVLQHFEDRLKGVEEDWRATQTLEMAQVRPETPEEDLAFDNVFKEILGLTAQVTPEILTRDPRLQSLQHPESKMLSYARVGELPIDKGGKADLMQAAQELYSGYLTDALTRLQTSDPSRLDGLMTSLPKALESNKWAQWSKTGSQDAAQVQDAIEALQDFAENRYNRVKNGPIGKKSDKR